MPVTEAIPARERAPLLVFALCWCAGLVVIGFAGSSLSAELALFPVLALGIFTWRLTTPAPAVLAPSGRVRAQLVVLVAYTLLAIVKTLHWHAMIDAPVFDPFDAFEDWLRPIVGIPTRIINPVFYVVIPGLVIWLLGATARELGLTRGRYSLRMIALWGTLPVVFLVGCVAGGFASPALISRVALDHLVQNGPIEEFFWRGLVQTRLQRFGSAWAIVLTALIFALAHLAAQLQGTDGDVLLATARCITNQASTGLAFGVIFHRTRSLLAPSVVHVLLNTALDVSPI